MVQYNQEIYEKIVHEYQQVVSKGFSKDDFCTYYEILFSCHSCGIEGNSFTVDETAH